MRISDWSSDVCSSDLMYHEIAEPYAFLWRLYPALKMSGEVIVVDANRPTEQHGTPPRLLKYELEAVGYRLVAITPRPDAGGYLARFNISGNRPEPHDIVPCGIRRAGGQKSTEGDRKGVGSGKGV